MLPSPYDGKSTLHTTYTHICGILRFRYSFAEDLFSIPTPSGILVDLYIWFKFQNHQGQDYCPLNLVNRQVFRMVNHLILYFDILPEPGRHSPLEYEEEKFRRRYNLCMTGNQGYLGLKGFNDSCFVKERERKNTTGKDDESWILKSLHGRICENFRNNYEKIH